MRILHRKAVFNVQKKKPPTPVHSLATSALMYFKICHGVLCVCVTPCSMTALCERRKGNRTADKAEIGVCVQFALCIFKVCACICMHFAYLKCVHIYAFFCVSACLSVCLCRLQCVLVFMYSHKVFGFVFQRKSRGMYVYGCSVILLNDSDQILSQFEIV